MLHPKTTIQTEEVLMYQKLPMKREDRGNIKKNKEDRQVLWAEMIQEKAEADNKELNERIR